MVNFFNVGHTVLFPSLTCLTYQNEHNMWLNFPRCLSSKTYNNTLDIDVIYNLKIRKTFNSQLKIKKNYSFTSFKKR
jgi:hypothetical protein